MGRARPPTPEDHRPVRRRPAAHHRRRPRPDRGVQRMHLQHEHLRRVLADHHRFTSTSRDGPAQQAEPARRRAHHGGPVPGRAPTRYSPATPTTSRDAGSPGSAPRTHSFRGFFDHTSGQLADIVEPGRLPVHDLSTELVTTHMAAPGRTPRWTPCCGWTPPVDDPVTQLDSMAMASGREARCRSWTRASWTWRPPVARPPETGAQPTKQTVITDVIDPDAGARVPARHLRTEPLVATVRPTDETIPRPLHKGGGIRPGHLDRPPPTSGTAGCRPGRLVRYSDSHR